jgi:acetyl esterase/lipase
VFWDDEKYRGEAYAAFAWAVYVAEVTVDLTTYSVSVDEDYGLLVHGDNDSTVRLAQSEAMAKALRQHGVQNELVVIKGGEHSLLRPQMRLRLYTKLEAFLAANLGTQ